MILQELKNDVPIIIWYHVIAKKYYVESLSSRKTSKLKQQNVATSTSPPCHHREPDPYADIHLGDSQANVGFDAFERTPHQKQTKEIDEMEAIFANLRTNSKTKHQGIRCLKYFEINFNASNRVEQGCRAQMSGTRKLKTGSHLAGSKKNDIFLRQQVGQWNYYGQIMTSHTVCRSICSQVPWSRLWKVAVAMHWQCKDARKTQWVWKWIQHAAKHPSTQTSEPFAAGISFLILFDIHHTRCARCDTWNIFKLKPLHWCVKKRESKNHDQSWNESQPHANTSIQVLFIPETTLGPSDPWKGIVDDDERCIKGIYLSRF